MKHDINKLKTLIKILWISFGVSTPILSLTITALGEGHVISYLCAILWIILLVVSIIYTKRYFKLKRVEMIILQEKEKEKQKMEYERALNAELEKQKLKSIERKKYIDDNLSEKIRLSTMCDNIKNEIATLYNTYFSSLDNVDECAYILTRIHKKITVIYNTLKDYDFYGKFNYIEEFKKVENEATELLPRAAKNDVHYSNGIVLSTGPSSDLKEIINYRKENNIY